MVDIRGLDKAEVLIALWRASKCQGISFMGYAPLSYGQAYAEILKRKYFDYLNGKVMKVDLSGCEFNERLYDRDNGAGAAQRAIDKLRENGGTNDA